MIANMFAAQKSFISGDCAVYYETMALSNETPRGRAA